MSIIFSIIQIVSCYREAHRETERERDPVKWPSYITLQKYPRVNQIKHGVVIHLTGVVGSFAVKDTFVVFKRASGIAPVGNPLELPARRVLCTQRLARLRGVRGHEWRRVVGVTEPAVAGSS